MPGIMSNQPCFRQGTHPLPQLSHMLYLQSAINDLISLGPLQPLRVCLCNWTGESSPRVDCWKFPFVYWDKAPVFGRICPLTLMKVNAWIIRKYLDEVFGYFPLISLGNMLFICFKLMNLEIISVVISLFLHSSHPSSICLVWQRVLFGFPSMWMVQS